jgi:hypothetical protein
LANPRDSFDPGRDLAFDKPELNFKVGCNIILHIGKPVIPPQEVYHRPFFPSLWRLDLLTIGRAISAQKSPRPFGPFRPSLGHFPAQFKQTSPTQKGG